MKPRQGYSLIEVLVVLGIITILIALLLAAIQKGRLAAARTTCLNNLKQLSLASHNYMNVQGAFPSGSTPRSDKDYPSLGWVPRLLPFLEQDALWNEAVVTYKAKPWGYHDTYYHPDAKPLKNVVCPADPRAGDFFSQEGIYDYRISLSSYVGVAGEAYDRRNGVLYTGSRIKSSDITDGLSNTLLLGERPPSADTRVGWWYAGAGTDGEGAIDLHMGVMN